MEINTTIGEFSESIKGLNKPLSTPIKVIIEDNSSKTRDQNIKKETKYPFLHSGFWEGQDTPTDLAENHDKYLYDEE